MAKEDLLEVEDLCVEYWTDSAKLRAVDRVSFSLRPGETLGLAGESGSGKSTLAQSILRILNPPGVITGGRLLYKGADILEMDEEALRHFRWREVSMVFQSAMNALNPVMTIGDQIADTLAAHAKEPLSRTATESKARELLSRVGIDPDRIRSYPHQLSGGMRQRVVIAIALALSPKLIILDEPTTALDVVVQREILQEILSLQKSLGFAVLFITHDLPLMLQVCDRVGILYGGRLAEIGPAEILKNRAQHPYTQGLMTAFPSLHGRHNDLSGIDGPPLNLATLPSGCRFHPRCPKVMEACSKFQPDEIRCGDGHRARCHLLTQTQLQSNAMIE
jgi:peptide/nickel transport system ATP-binding protein